MEREDWNKRYETKDLVWTAQANRFLVAEVEDLPPGRALDLAAGEGRNAVWLAEKGWQVVAVDFSDVGLAKGRRLAEDRGVAVAWEQADLRKYAPARAAYDLVIVFYLQVPWPTLSPILESAAAAVAPGGTFLLVGHDTSNLERGHGGPSSPEVLYTPEQITPLLRDLEIQNAQTVVRPVETDDGPREALDCLVRARRPRHAGGEPAPSAD